MAGGLAVAPLWVDDIHQRTDRIKVTTTLL